MPLRDSLYINLYSPFNMVETTTKKTNKKHSQQTITHYDSDITCPEISSDDDRARHSANQ